MGLMTTCKRISELNPDMAVEVGSLEQGWFRASELTQPGSTLLKQGLSLAANRYQAAMDRRTMAAFLIGRYAFDVPAIVVASYLFEVRVPVFTPDNVALRFETCTWKNNGTTGEHDRLRVRLLSDRMAVLSDDTANGQDGVVVMNDRTALRDALRASVEAHMSPLIEVVCAKFSVARPSVISASYHCPPTVTMWLPTGAASLVSKIWLVVFSSRCAPMIRLGKPG